MARSRRYDDDDEDDLPPRRSPRASQNSGGNTAVKIVAIVGGVLLAIFLVCGGIGFYIFWSAKKAVNEVGKDFAQRADKMQEEQRLREQQRENSDKRVSLKAAEAFNQEVKSRRGDGAYEMTSDAYQRRVPLEQFNALIERYRVQIGTGLPFSEDIFAPDSGRSYIFKRTLHDRGGFLEMSVTMVKVGTGWKVDRFTIEPKR